MKSSELLNLFQQLGVVSSGHFFAVGVDQRVSNQQGGDYETSKRYERPARPIVQIRHTEYLLIPGINIVVSSDQLEELTGNSQWREHIKPGPSGYGEVDLDWLTRTRGIAQLSIEEIEQRNSYR